MAQDRHKLVREALHDWRDSLINLTGTNRLLNFKPRKTSTVAIARPEPAEIFAGLEVGRTFFFRSLAPGEVAGPPELSDRHGSSSQAPGLPPPAIDRLDTLATAREMHGALRTLLRRADSEYLDRGLRVLYLAFGTLTWVDVDGTCYTSPLLLVPVRLLPTGPQQPPNLVPTDEDRAVNPALALKLARHNLNLPTVGCLDELSLAGFLDACRATVASQTGWRVTDTVQLSYFSFAKEAMYRDLLDNEDLVSAHPAIQAMATGGRGEGTTEFLFDEIVDERIDIDASPESAALVLDADSSQRACVAASVAGQSFVMDGPPGTGKSQTIANMIAALLHGGKTVLFVSEKAAALDVVRDRLAEVGLGLYLLELHSHKATRKEVALALGAALDTVTVAPDGLSALDRNDVRTRREQLNAYAKAMNEVRQPLGFSLHTVLGMIAAVPSAPVAPLTGLAPAGLSLGVFGEIRHQCAALARAWRPAVEGASYLWRGVKERGSFEATLFQARSALQNLQTLAELSATAGEAFNLRRPSEADRLAMVLLYGQNRPAGVPDLWLTSLDLRPVQQRIERLATDLGRLRAVEQQTAARTGVPWQIIPASATCPAPDLDCLASLSPVGVTLDEITNGQARLLAETFARDAQMLNTREGSLSGLAAMLGLPAPETFQAADNLLAIAAVAGSDLRPEAAWLTGDGLNRAVVSTQVIQAALTGLSVAEAAALTMYRPQALQADVAGLEERFRTIHHGLKRLLGEYRSDRKTVAGITMPGVAPGAAYRHLALLTEWKQALGRLDRSERIHAPFLGRFYSGRGTDFSRLQQALQLTRQLLDRTPDLNLTGAAGQISAQASPNPDLVRISRETHLDLDAWRSTLAPQPVLSGRPQLSLGSLAAAAAWLDIHRQPLTAVIDFTQQVSDAVGRPVSVREARHLIACRGSVDDVLTALDGHREQDIATLEGLYTGPGTDLQAIRSSLAWAQAVRTRLHGTDAPLAPAQVKVLGLSAPADRLHVAAQAWKLARDAIAMAFDASRRPGLLSELDDYQDAADLLQAFADDAGGQDEWFAHNLAKQQLAGHGLGAAVDFCATQRVSPAQVSSVIELALLREWADHVLRTDPALVTVRAQDRDALVQEFRRLDTALIETAAADVIRACNDRRPRSDIGQAAVIRREAAKRTKHMPVRLLLDRSRSVTQAIKPCFMMSPLAVSQYLPADMHFDVVIFDEASQVPPGEAINCIYRGSALITAGDQKQLPPTAFFAASADDGEEWSEENENTKDFESILDLAKASGAFKSLTLRWHYRSRHEALIAFSNDAFYDGRLITFPGAEDVGPNVGIELFLVEGVYRRGSTRDNPIEADKVAERVLHHYDTRPSLTLGVVTFSEAQAVAVESAVERARLDRPDLDRFFAEDRLHGFFVKNLESVQGDERDVMIFSLGYGPDENHKTTMNFGPLNRDGGWRRLNVAITRARYRNEIISSLTAADITPTTTSDGVRHLRRYLDFAARGLTALALDSGQGGDAESPFEESVLAAVRSWGYDATPQVGGAGYRIDMGIRHPDHSGVYVLGVECDGLRYHSSKVARDRDRLREQVLRGLGWKLHRIWGTAWYRNRSGEMNRLRAAIERAVALPVRGLLSSLEEPDLIDRPPVLNEAATFHSEPDWSAPYTRAVVAPLARCTDPGGPRCQSEMVSGIRTIVAAEAPVHLTLIHKRLREAWNIGRIGVRIRNNIEAAIRSADVIRDGDFLLSTQILDTVRTPTHDVARTVEHVHDGELQLALRNLVRDTGGITPEALTAAVSGVFGWARRSPEITARMKQLIENLLTTGNLQWDGEALTTPPPAEPNPRRVSPRLP